ncbi:hypothetical protein BGZ54_004121, partial [Gamsiella multidivaricata]
SDYVHILIHDQPDIHKVQQSHTRTQFEHPHEKQQPLAPAYNLHEELLSNAEDQAWEEDDRLIRKWDDEQQEELMLMAEKLDGEESGRLVAEWEGEQEILASKEEGLAIEEDERLLTEYGGKKRVQASSVIDPTSEAYERWLTRCEDEETAIISREEWADKAQLAAREDEGDDMPLLVAAGGARQRCRKHD